MEESCRIKKEVVASVTIAGDVVCLNFISGVLLRIAPSFEDIPGLLSLTAISQRYGTPLGLCLGENGQLEGIGSLLQSVPRAIWKNQREEWNMWFWISPITFSFHPNQDSSPRLVARIQEAIAEGKPVTAVVRGNRILDVTDVCIKELEGVSPLAALKVCP